MSVKSLSSIKFCHGITYTGIGLIFELGVIKEIEPGCFCNFISGSKIVLIYKSLIKSILSIAKFGSVGATTLTSGYTSNNHL